MKKHLEKLRKQPDHKKEKMVTTLAIIVTSAIVVIWLLLLSVAPKDDAPETNERSFQDGINSFFEASVNQISNLQEEFTTGRENFEFDLEAAIQEEVEITAEAEQEEPEQEQENYE